MPRLQRRYRFAIDEQHRNCVDATYDTFLSLARQIPGDSSSAPSELTDSPIMAQLQDLYYLLTQEIISIKEDRARDGRPYLMLQIHRHP